MLANLFFNFLFCYGIKIATEEGMIFGFVSVGYRRLFKIDHPKNWFHNLMYYISKPIFNCLPCMASVWGAVFVLISPTVAYDLISYDFLVHAVCLVAFNAIGAQIASMLEPKF